MRLSFTRAMLAAALSGQLDKVPTLPDPIFGVAVPQSCPGVPPEVLMPRTTWKSGEAYDQKARQLAGLFQVNFKAFAPRVADAVRQAGPRGT